MSLSRQRPPCSWNYCGTCKHRRTRYPNSSQCKNCYENQRTGGGFRWSDAADRERERIAVFVAEQGDTELAELIRNRAHL